MQFSIEQLRSDPALSSSGRGDRKLAVWRRWPGTERPADAVEWRAPQPGEVCPVLEIEGLEFAVFTERAKQTRHVHFFCTEVYTVLSGRVRIEAGGSERLMQAGDSLVVPAGVPHAVRPVEGEFLCQVVAVGSRGPQDRLEVPLQPE